MQIRALTWNVYHGRDAPPDPALLTWRSRLLRTSERNETHVQVNRGLFGEFASLLASADWDLAMLQELPPRWGARMAAACDASAHRVLTSRNFLAPLRGLAAELNPDLIASHEGGSNLTLVRRRAGSIVERRELELRKRGRVERRTLGFARVRLASDPPAEPQEICIANLHATAGDSNQALAEAEVRFAAERCVRWARGAPLILGGDFNVRPRASALYEELADRLRLTGTTAPDAIDHLLTRDLELSAGPRAWPPEAREIREEGLAIRLSDHAPVEATFELEPPRRAPGCVAADATE
jgi:endonuclease/exonuclease/phosphatase family metal-dependent hydrolase